MGNSKNFIRILFLSDTHLGFDLPFRPRIVRRRRGPDFFENFRCALKPALEGKVDCVVHGGDVLYRSKVPSHLVEMAFEPLHRVADSGIPVFLVPGNHERSDIPHRALVEHPKIHIFHRPCTYLLPLDRFTLGLSGFPYVRNGIRHAFSNILEATKWQNTPVDCHVLCIHQCAEGATVGPKNYTFRDQMDVIRLGDIPEGFTAVLSGHIHRFQVLRSDLEGRPIAAPVFYSGSIERTSFAEKDERKGYLILKISRLNPRAHGLNRWRFCEVPTRPMKQVEVNANTMNANELQNWLVSIFETLPKESVVKVRVHGKIGEEIKPVLGAASLRAIAPPTMNVVVTLVDERRYAT